MRIGVLLVTLAAAAPRLASAQALPARLPLAPAPVLATCAAQASPFARLLSLACMPASAGLRTIPAAGYPDHREGGAILGALAMGIMGVGLGYAVCAGGESGPRFGNCARAIGMFGMAGITVGLGVGSLIGSMIPREPAPAEP